MSIYPSPEAYFLVIDQGGHASRAVLFDHQGTLIKQNTQPIETFCHEPDRVEHSPQEVIKSIRQAIALVVEEAIRENRIPGDAQIVAGLATQRSSIVCWDAITGESLGPVISWQDRRARDIIERLASHGDEVSETTGLRLSAHYGASKMNWCLNNLESVQQAYKENRLLMGPLSSYISFNLLEGRPKLVDPANASRTLLWSMNALDWDKSLLQLFSIPVETLPECVYTRHHFGSISLKNRSIPLEMITGDQSAAVFAQGKLDPAIVYINMGSGAFVQRRNISAAAPSHLLESIVYADSEETVRISEGTVNGAGTALNWFADTYNCKDLESKLQEWLSEVSSPDIFLNGVGGVGSPFWIPHMPSAFVDEDNSGVAEKAVAVVESILFLVQANLDEMIETGPQIDRLCVSGGLASQDGICQRLADLSGLTVFRPDQQEATAYGLAWLLAGQPATWKEHNKGNDFKPKEGGSIQQRYRHWQQLMRQS